MDRCDVLPDVREETVEDLNAKWRTWPELKRDVLTEEDEAQAKEEIRKQLQKMNAKTLNEDSLKAAMKGFEDEAGHTPYNDVTYPRHYAGDDNITCKDALNSMMTPLVPIITPQIGYWLGCTFKYIWRAFLKGDPGRDLLKAKQCIDEMLNLM